MTSFTVATGSTVTTAKTVGNNDIGTIEAGGVLTGPQGGPPASAMTVAGNPHVQAQLLAVLDGFG